VTLILLILLYAIGWSYRYLIFSTSKSFGMALEGMLGLTQKCIQLKPPIGDKHLTELMFGIIGEKIQIAQMLTKKELTLQGFQNVREWNPALKFLEEFPMLVKERCLRGLVMQKTSDKCFSTNRT